MTWGREKTATGHSIPTGHSLGTPATVVYTCTVDCNNTAEKRRNSVNYEQFHLN